MVTYLALLQGINLGPNRRIAMPALRESLQDLGFADVATYIQSGNVVFASAEVSREDLEAAISDKIGSAFNLGVPVIVRTGYEILRIFGSNPFLPGEDDVKRLHVTFLDHAPGSEAKAQVEKIAFPPDEFRIEGREVFVRHMAGVSGSPIDFRLIGRMLCVRTMTSRNWRTVTRLAEMVRDRA